MTRKQKNVELDTLIVADSVEIGKTVKVLEEKYRITFLEINGQKPHPQKKIRKGDRVLIFGPFDKIFDFDA